MEKIIVGKSVYDVIDTDDEGLLVVYKSVRTNELSFISVDRIIKAIDSGADLIDLECFVTSEAKQTVNN